MRHVLNSDHWTDEEGRPAGGCSWGTGYTIAWHDETLGRGEDRKVPGAFVEDVIAAAIDRLEFYHGSESSSCGANEGALEALRLARGCLDDRTKDREVREVEGTHAP